jgi:putative DNA primase/helicase
VTAALLPHHLAMLRASAISDEVIAARRYDSIGRDSMHDSKEGSRARLRRLKIPRHSRDADTRYPGLLIPLYAPTGEIASCQYRPDSPGTDPKTKKPVKYASPGGRGSVLDVHPFNSADRPDEHRPPRIADTTIPLWITEGTKKADALASRGLCVVALSGVFNWRSPLGTLGDWEDVPLKNRQVGVIFDADARTNASVARAMARLGAWLKSKGAASVIYVMPPPELNGAPTKGVDDYLAAGGTLDALFAAALSSAPTVPIGDQFTDARMAETVAEDVLDGRYLWTAGMGWMAWHGTRWRPTDDKEITEVVRVYVLERHAHAAAALAKGELDAAVVAGWHKRLSAAAITAVVRLAAGEVRRDAADFDADPDVLNTPNGIVDTRTGEVAEHDPDRLITKITSGSYRPGFTHPDWEQALAALPDQTTRDWLQARIGQGATGHRSPDGVNVILQGGGENGKGAIGTDGVVPALGDYASVASHKLIAGDARDHSEEQASLRGRRLLIAEELTEGRALNVTAIKRISDVASITARHVYGRNMTFDATHTLLATTNYMPVVNEVDHGTWRRLALLIFPYTFRKPHEQLLRDTDRRGDPDLKRRIEHNVSGQHDAIVTWAVEGAMRWHRDGAAALAPSPWVDAATDMWRRTADRILGWWHAHLVADRSACIPATDMLDAFNAWLADNGHNRWSRESFAPRFATHTETTRHGVESRREQRPEGVSRWAPAAYALPAKPLPDKVWVWRGVRFRTAADDAVGGHGGPGNTGADRGARVSDNFLHEGLPRKVSEDSGTSGTNINLTPPTNINLRPPTNINRTVPAACIAHRPDEMCSGCSPLLKGRS